MSTKEEVLHDIAHLSPADQEAIKDTVLGPPPANFAGWLWIMVVAAFVAVLVGGMVLTYLLVRDGQPTEVIVPIVTAAVGVLAGLLAPSPSTINQKPSQQ